MVLYSVYKATFLTKKYKTKRFYIGYTGNAEKRADKLKLGKTFWLSCMLPGSMEMEMLRTGVEGKSQLA